MGARSRPPEQQCDARRERRPLDRSRRSNRRRAEGRRAQGTPGPGSARNALRPGRRDPVFVRPQAHEHRAHRRDGGRPGPPGHEGCARYPARSLYARAGRRRRAPSDRRAARRDSHWRSSGSPSEALRTLGLAHRVLPPAALERLHDSHEGELVWLGVVGMIDPPRPEARAAVATARAAGVRVVMITGDHPLTAIAIARELGIAGSNDAPVTGADLRE